MRRLLHSRRVLAAAIALAALAPGCTVDPPSAAVTYENLYEREQYWPFHVRLVQDWQPEGFEGERFGYGLGVLIRVEPSGDLRVDFARHGRHRVPARVTDVVEEANRIRLGETAKSAPNFVLAVVNKMLDPTSDPIAYVAPPSVAKVEAFLLVAADPESERFAELSAALGQLREREDVMPVLLPQGGRTDARVLERCRQLGWTGPFVHSRFAAAYTESILGEPLELPRVMLQSPEGRVLYSGAWSAEASAEIAAAIDRELGATAELQRVPYRRLGTSSASAGRARNASSAMKKAGISMPTLAVIPSRDEASRMRSFSIGELLLHRRAARV